MSTDAQKYMNILKLTNPSHQKRAQCWGPEEHRGLNAVLWGPCPALRAVPCRGLREERAAISFTSLVPAQASLRLRGSNNALRMRGRGCEGALSLAEGKFFWGRNRRVCECWCVAVTDSSALRGAGNEWEDGSQKEAAEGALINGRGDAAGDAS